MQGRHDGGMLLIGMASLDAQDRSEGRGRQEAATAGTVLADAVVEAKRALHQAQATALALAQRATAWHSRWRAVKNVLILYWTKTDHES